MSDRARGIRARLRRAWARLAGGLTTAARTRRAAELLTAALGEEDSARRVVRLRAALAAGEALAGEAGDVTVMEASLHLGEKLRALGQRDEAVEHFARAVERSYRVGDPVGRQRRAGVLTRLGILDQEAGHLARARLRYREALDLGSDTDSGLLLGMLTQAAFNLGLLDTDGGDADAARASWECAIALGSRAGHPSGWDPAAVAAFNLGHLFARRGDFVRARDVLESVGRIGEPSGTPLARMAVAKAELALAGIAEREGLAGEPDAQRHYARALALGRECPLPEGALAAMQAGLALGEMSLRAGRYEDSVARYREALATGERIGETEAHGLRVLGELRLGQALAEHGERDEALRRLETAFDGGRTDEREWVRELAAQAACTRHRVLCALERWDEARTLADEAEAFASTIPSGTGRALAAAARYARAFQRLHDGDQAGARTLLDEVAEDGFASGSDVGQRVALDARLLAGHLDRQAGRHDAALVVFRDVLQRLREEHAPEANGMAAMAGVNAGHCLLALGRALEARHAYERALERGRASGTPAGRAAAANGALNLASLLAGEVPDERRREFCQLAISLGRSSRTPLGEACAKTAERALGEIPDGG